MTEIAATAVLAPDVTTDERAARSHLARRFLTNPLGIAALSVLVLIVLAAIFAPLLTSYDPNTVSVLHILQGPGAGHLLGTDGAGRDVWARLLYGARYTLAGALLATVVAAVLGITSGLVAGYYGKWFESSASWVTTLLMALPGIVVLLAARAVLGPSLWTVMIIFGVLLIPAFYRLVYAAVSGVRNELFVDAARVSGVSDRRIIARHILTVVRAPIILQASIVFGIAIAVQVGLDFLGFGDQAIPTWGNMLNDGFTNLYRDPQLVVWPALAVVITGVALTLFANALRDELEQSARPRRRRRATTVTPAEVAAATVTPAEVTPATVTAADPVRPESGTIVHEEPSSTAQAPLLLHIEDLAVGYPQADGSVCEMRSETEDGARLNCNGGLGSATFVTGAFGFAAAGFVVRKIAESGGEPSLRS